MTIWFYCPKCKEHLVNYHKWDYLKKIAICRHCNWEGAQPIRKEKRMNTKESIERIRDLGLHAVNRTKIENLEHKVRMQQDQIIRLESRMKQILLVFHLLLKHSEGKKEHSIKEIIAFVDKIVKNSIETNKDMNDVDLVNELMKR